LEFLGILLEIRLEFKWNSSGFIGILEIPRKFRD
jgi:hypothetical protein